MCSNGPIGGPGCSWGQFHMTPLYPLNYVANITDSRATSETEGFTSDSSTISCFPRAWSFPDHVDSRVFIKETRCGSAPKNAPRRVPLFAQTPSKLHKCSFRISNCGERFLQYIPVMISIQRRVVPRSVGLAARA